ncbi:hypothetical protein EVA_09846 [gut metagenome]|uniref:Uncharacterized protein n=1 Tax=gut metagenome TaxID=749906 RepID=J9G5D2_9ZZZZ
MPSQGCRSVGPHPGPKVHCQDRSPNSKCPKECSPVRYPENAVAQG